MSSCDFLSWECLAGQHVCQVHLRVVHLAMVVLHGTSAITSATLAAAWGPGSKNALQHQGHELLARRDAALICTTAAYYWRHN